MAFKVKPIPLDLTRRYRQRIISIGIELEGGWEKLPSGTELVRDGSVRGLTRGQVGLTVEQQARRDHLNNASASRFWTDAEELEMRTMNRILLARASSGGLHIGELPSQILSMKNSSSTFWESWMRAFYPHAVNATCGMHVHMHFGGHRPHVYQRLMVEEYPATVVREFQGWWVKHEAKMPQGFEGRLAGESEFCQHTFQADAQVLHRDKHYDHHTPGNRYSVINYCWGRYQTAECRLLPMFGTNDKSDVETAIEAIRHLLLITNIFLVTTRGREPVHVTDFQVDETSYREELIECV